MKNNKNEVYRYDRKKQQFVNEPLKKQYDNEFADDYEFEDRTLQLQKDQIKAYTKNSKSKSKTNCKDKDC